MAIDKKYGRVTLERGTIGEDEPVFVFRAQDELLLPVLNVYMQLALVAGSPTRHIAAIVDNFETIESWQASNPTKIPSSDPV